MFCLYFFFTALDKRSAKVIKLHVRSVKVQILPVLGPYLWDLVKT